MAAKSGAVVEEERKGPNTVTFPNPGPQEFPSCKLEVEDSDQDMSPKNMWQVYALGGFLILRWVWARWSERRRRQNSSSAAPSE